MTTFNLEKNDTFDLTKDNPKLNKVKVVLSWTTPKSTIPPLDADLSLFGLKIVNGNPKLHSNEYFIYYKKEKTPNESIVKSPDERSGGSEIATIDISKLPNDLDEISLVVTLFKGQEYHQSFGLTKDMQLEIFNDETGESIFFVDIDETASDSTAIQIGSFFKDENRFSFKAISTGYKLSLLDFINSYSWFL